MIPQEFQNVTALAKANIYFDGRVASHTILLPGGAKKTPGLIYPGQFHFGTGQAERMEIVDGSPMHGEVGRTKRSQPIILRVECSRFRRNRGLISLLRRSGRLSD